MKIYQVTRTYFVSDAAETEIVRKETEQGEYDPNFHNYSIQWALSEMDATGFVAGEVEELSSSCAVKQAHEVDIHQPFLDSLVEHERSQRKAAA